MERIDGFTQNTIFIRFCISCIRAIFDERTCGYESCQPCKAAEIFIIVETLISLRISQLTDMFLRKMHLRSILHL